jgi:hypothetical protein
MAQVVKAGTGCSVWAAQSELPGEPDENDMRPDLAWRSPGLDNKHIVTVATQPFPDCHVIDQCLPRRRVEWQESAFAELAVPDDQPIIREIVASQGQGFRDA